MSEFLLRQLSVLQNAVNDYRGGSVSLSRLINTLGAIDAVVQPTPWEDRLFRICVELESINSEVIDKRRAINADEVGTIALLLKAVDELVSDHQK